MRKIMLIVVMLSFLIQGLVLSEYKQSNGSKVDTKQEKPINVKKFKNGEKRFYKDFEEYIFNNSKTRIIVEKVDDGLIKILDDKNNILKTFKKYYKKEEIVEPDEDIIKKFSNRYKECKDRKIVIGKIGGAGVWEQGIISESESVYKYFEQKRVGEYKPIEEAKRLAIYDIQGNKLWEKQYGTSEGAGIKGVSEDGKIIVVCESKPATIIPEWYIGPPYNNECIIVYNRNGEEIIRTKEGNYDFHVEISPNGRFVVGILRTDSSLEVYKGDVIGIDIEKKKIIEYRFENKIGWVGIKDVNDNGDVVIIRAPDKEEKSNIKKLEK